MNTSKDNNLCYYENLLWNKKQQLVKVELILLFLCSVATEQQFLEFIHYNHQHLQVSYILY